MDNAVLQNMRQRRSCRAFLPQQITLEEMETVIEAGAWAASGMGRQPVVFVAVQDKATRDTLSALNAKWMGKEEGFDPFYGAPTVVVVLVKADIPTAVEDGSLAIGNMMNAAASIGLGSCWIHRARQIFDSEEGKALLAAWGMDQDHIGIGHCVLGYAAQPAVEGAPRKEGRLLEVL